MKYAVTWIAVQHPGGDQPQQAFDGPSIVLDADSKRDAFERAWRMIIGAIPFDESMTRASIHLLVSEVDDGAVKH